MAGNRSVGINKWPGLIFQCRVLGPLAIGAFLGSACSDAPGPAAAPRQTLVVEHTAEDLATTPEWRLSAQPRIQIGRLDGSPEYTLYRVVTARRLSDGRIVVVDRQQEIRFFDAGGRYLASSGGRGGGPGEFRQLSNLFTTVGDTILVYDAARRRISVYAPDGEYSRSFTLSVPIYPRGLRRLSDGSWIALEYEAPGLTSETRTVRAELAIVHMEPYGAFQDTIATVQGPTWYGSRAAFSGVGFAAQPQLAAGGERVAFSSSDRYEIEVRHLQRALHHISVDLPRRPVTDADITTAEEPSVSRPDRPPEVGNQDLEPRYAKYFPAIADLVYDASGNLWVRRYAKARGAEDRWDVFDADGRAIAHVYGPSGFRFTDVGNDYILGVFRDEMGVEYVRSYRLIK